MTAHSDILQAGQNQISDATNLLPSCLIFLGARDPPIPWCEENRRIAQGGSFVSAVSAALCRLKSRSCPSGP